MRGILCFLAARQHRKFRLGEGATRPTLIEIVDDVTGAGQAPVKGGVNRKGADEALKRTALRKAPSPATLILEAGERSSAAGKLPPAKRPRGV